MKHVFLKLIPPRPSFAQDMTEAEAKLMNEHAAYWRDLKDGGLVLAYALGVVADPKGLFGAGILELEDNADAQALGDGDPTIRANKGFRLEIHPMPRASVNK